MFIQNCPLCPETNTFTCRQKLVHHLTIYHRDDCGQLLYRCCHCNETYENYKSLGNHMSRRHSKPSNEEAAGSSHSSSASEEFRDAESGPNNEDVPLLDCLFEEAVSILKLEKQLKFKAATLLIKLKDVHNATQRVVDTVISGVNSMFDSVLDVLVNKFSIQGESEVFSVHEIVAMIEQLRGQTMFEGVETPDKLEEYMDNEQGLIKPVKVVPEQKQVIKNNIVKTIDTDFAYIVPFEPSLEKILKCPEVLHCVENPLPVKPGVFTSPLDSYFYLNHPVVEQDPHTLGIGLYADGVDLTDSASSKSGVHAVTFIYFILFNIYPKLRSSVRAIFLLGCVKSSVLKKHGFDKILEDFIAVMNRLSSSEGIKFNGLKKVFHAIFICFCGDNPASENIGGFKESHFAAKPCRQCFVSRNELFKYFKESSFTLRTMNLHQEQVELVEAYLSNPQRNEDNPSVTYGINRRSCLMSINGCDVTKCLPQDYLHDTIEGTLKLEICCLLLDVLEKNQMTISVINTRVQLFAKRFGVNKPAVIEKRYLEKRKLRQTAAEMLCLAYTLPFVLRKKEGDTMVSVCSKDNLKCYLMRLQLMDLLMAEEFTYSDIEVIRKLIENHHLLFYSLYQCVTPKMHYEVHLTQVLLYGPPRHYWCFRFEGKHSYFKRLLRIYRCFKDPAGTFARSHQRKLCGLMLLSSKGDCGPFLKPSDSLGSAQEKSLRSLLHFSGLLDIFIDISRDAMLSLYKVVCVNGVTYRKTDVITVSTVGSLPVFGEIAQITSYDGKVVFMYRQLLTLSYNEAVHAYKVRYCVGRDYGVIVASELPHRHQLFSIKSSGAYYIVAPNSNFRPYAAITI